jgi:LuxR family maltose regulon positive regulatory protein
MLSIRVCKILASYLQTRQILVKVIMILLHTKFLIPRFTTSRIGRPHLTSLIRDNIEQQFVMLIAPPGYGKTMLMADAAAALNCPILWYQLDEGDSDAATFMAYLVEGLCKILPDAGTQIRITLANSGVVPPDRALVVLLNQLLQSPPQRWVLVLDDYHLVTNSAVHRLTESLLENVVPGMSVMLASRSTPALPIARWRARGQLLELRPDQLRFSSAEVESWLINSDHLIPAPEIQQIVETTEGWGAGIQLAMNLLSELPADDASTLTVKLRGAHQHVFNYLMEEVFSRQPTDLQQFLLESAVLTQVNAETCEEILGSPQARHLIERIEDDNLFLVSLDQERHWFRYHHLFREFLLEKLNREDSQRLCDLRRKAALCYQAGGELETALNYALAADDRSHAAEILSRFALDWLEQGYVEALSRYFRQVGTVIEANPELLLIYGRVLRQLGQLSEATQKFQHAYAASMQHNIPDLAFRALNELATLARSQGDYLRAGQFASQVVGEADRVALKTRAFALMELAKSQGFLEGMNLGSTLATQAVEVMEQAGTAITAFDQAQLLRSLAQICWWHGDVNTAIRHGEEALRRVPNKRSPLAAEIMMTLATPNLYRHDYEAALAYAEQALAICQQLEVRELLPTAFTVLGNTLTRLDRLDEAESALRTAIQHCNDLGAEQFAQIMAAGYLAYNLFVHDRVQDAIQIAETALWPYEGLPIVYEVYVCRSVLADSYLSDGQTLRAERIFADLIDVGEKRQYRIPLSMAYFGLAYIRLTEGDKRTGVELAQRSLTLLESSMAWELYVDQGERAQVVCGALAEVLPNNTFIRRVLSTVSQQRESSVSAEVMPEPPIRIQAFGEFRVFCEGVELPPKAWVSSKARDLLAYFVTYRNTPLSVDRALDALWGPAGERSSSAFHSAMHRLRSALQTQGEYRKFVTVDSGMYVLDHACFSIDVDLFDSAIRDARAAEPHEATALYERAVGLYAGHYLENIDYFWVIAEQKRLKESYLRALRLLEEACVTRNDLDGCLAYARKQLVADPLQEHMHASVMRYLAQTGNRTEVIRHFRSLEEMLSSQLGTTPSPAIRDLFASLTGT